jgi:type III secretion system FlhB-like substrate exporter
MSTQKVVGVGFGPDDSAPTVVLKAAGADAAALIEKARAQGTVPIVHMPELAQRVYRTPIDAPIDKELFPVMAALLVHVMKSDRLQQGRAK